VFIGGQFKKCRVAKRQGAELRRPLAIAIIFGLSSRHKADIVATVLTLIVVLVGYWVLQRIEILLFS